MAGNKMVGVLITGDASGATKAIKLTEDQLDSLNKKVGHTSTTMKAWTSDFASHAVSAAKWGAATVAAGAAAGAAMLKMSLNTAEATGVLAQKLGITTESLSKLQYAAKISDVSASSLEAGLKKLSVTLTNAATPGNAMAKVFGAIEVDAKKLIELPVDKQMGVIADALKRVENESIRSALAIKIFGKGGAELLPLMAEGSKGIAAFGDRLKDLGGVMSGDVVARAKTFNDTLDDIGIIGRGLAFQVMDKLLPAMQGLADRLVALHNNKAAMDGIARGLELIGRAAIGAAEGIAWLGEKIDAVLAAKGSKRVEYLTGEIAKLQQERARIQEQSGARRQGDIIEIGQKIKALEAERDALIQVRAANKDNGLEEIKVTATKKEAILSTGQLTAALGEETEADKEAAREKKQLEEALKREKEAIDGTIKSLMAKQAALKMTERDQARFAAQMSLSVTATDEQRQQIDALVQANYDAEASIKAAADAVDKQAKSVKESKAELDPWAAALQDTVARIDEAFANAWKGAGDGFKDFSDGLKEGFKQLLAELAHLAITKPIVMQIGTALGLGGASGVASAASGAGGLSSLLSGGSSLLGKLGGGLSGLGASLYGKMFDVASGLGLDSLGNAAFGKMTSYMGGSLGSNLLTAGGDVLGGLAGSFAANKLFSSRESATGGILGTAGGAIGSIYGPLGSAVGAFVGQAVDKLLGGSDFSGKRVKLGIGTGPMVEGDSDWKNVRTLSSGLQIGNLNRRTQDAGMTAEQMNAFFGTFDTLDATLTTLSQALGTNVNLAGRSLPGMPQSYDGGVSGGAFFGSLAKGELRANLKDAPKQFVKQWIEAVSDQFEESLRPLLRQIDGTVEEMLSEFEAIGNLRSTYTDAVDRMKAVLSVDVADVVDAIEKRSRTVYELWNEQSNLVRWFSNTIESAQDYQNFAGMVEQRYALELELIGQIRDALDQVSSAFGDSIEQIKLDLMETDEQRYNYFKEQADALAATLATLSDPTAITNTIGEIERLANSAYGLLDEGQKKGGMGQEFLDFFEETQQLATDRLNAVLADMGPEGKTGGAVQASIEAAMARWSAAFIAEAQTMFASSASAQQQAASTQQAAANTMVAAANSIPTNISVSVDLSSLNLAEVNV